MSSVLEQTSESVAEDAASAEERRARSPIPPLVGGIVLIVAGLAIAWQGFFELVVTDVIATRAQNQLLADFETRVDNSLATGVQRADYVESIEARTAPSEDPAIRATEAGFDDENDVPVMMASDDLLAADPVLPDEALPWVYETAPRQGEPLGRIVIPQADVDWVVVQGVTQEDLRKGPGHMLGTALPGQYGNAVISGHRTTYGHPFYHLNRLEPGDQFTVETVIGTHTYEVVEARVVAPTDVWVATQWDGAWMTLTTCHPRGSARQRLIVFSKMVDGPNAESAAAQFDGEYVVPAPPSA